MNVNEALFELKEQLINEPIVKEYFRLLSLIENDEQLSILDKEIKFHQKLMYLHCLFVQKLFLKQA